MQSTQKIREPLSSFQRKKGRSQEVYHANISDDLLGLRLLTGMLDNSSKLENSRLSYEKPGTKEGKLVGVTLTHFDPILDVIFLGIMTLGLTFHIISNDSFAARDLMVRTVFGNRETFNRQVSSISFVEEWTDSPQIVRPFLLALEELRPSCGGHWIK